MDKIAFSLNQEIDPQRIIHSISKLIEKKISSKEDADSCVLVVSIARVSNIVEFNQTKNIEA
jgi:hypothetical protein